MKVFLEIFLLFDVFIAGAVAATALRHALAHFRPHKHDAERPKFESGHLPPAAKEKLIETAEADFRTSIKHAADDLEKDLGELSGEISQMILKFGKDTLGDELNNYRIKLGELEKQSEADFAGLKQQLTEHHDNMKTKITEEVEAEKQRLLEQINSKLADAMVSFLLDTMQHNIDLGAQADYLTSVLEEHKTDFTQEVAGGEQPKA